MSVFGGFGPGTWQAWSLNLLSQVFVKAGIARGFQVTQTSPSATMAVLVHLDPTWSDGVLYLPNGGFMRIDAQATYSISNNTSGSTRTDALVAQVDPTNAGNTSLSVQANWASGFTSPSNNQFVIALISVANNATSIVNANITMNSAVATITGTNISGNNSIVASDGVGLSLQDNSATSAMTLVMTGLATGVGRSLVLQTTDTSAIGHPFTFDTTGSLTVGGGVIGSVAGVVMPMTRNNAASAAVLFTGTSTPIVGTAPTGSVWVKA